MKVLKSDENKFSIIPDRDITGKMVDKLKLRIEELIDKNVEIYLNMENVNFVVSSFVDVIVELNKKIKESGGKLIIKNCKENIIDLFKSLVPQEEIIINDK